MRAPLALWLAEAPRARFLATSRETLRVAGEGIFALGPLSLPREGGDVTSSEAVRLFLNRAALVRRGYGIGAAEWRIVKRGVLSACARLRHARPACP